MPIATSKSWKNLPLSPQRVALRFSASFSAQEAEQLRRGFIPAEMEDKWFIYFENNWLHFHRSWTGHEIFALRFEEEAGGLKVAESWASRDKAAYALDDLDLDRQTIRFLMDALLLGKSSRPPAPVSLQGSSGGGLLPRALGMLLGLHAGEALGAHLEFHSPLPRERWIREILGGGNFGWRPGQATDDTDLMLCVLRAIASVDQFRPAEHRRLMLKWIEGGPPDVGATTRRGLQKLRADPSLEATGDIAENSQGNGSLMRCAPLSLLRLPTVDLDKIIRLQAVPTHAHPRCVLADGILVNSLRALLSGGDKISVWKEAVKMAAHNDEELAQRLAGIEAVTWDILPTSGYVVDTLAAGFWALLHFADFEEALVQVTNRGLDSDTCGAVAGALVGAHGGVGCIPERWLRILERRQEIELEVRRILVPSV